MSICSLRFWISLFVFLFFSALLTWCPACVSSSPFFLFLPLVFQVWAFSNIFFLLGYVFGWFLPAVLFASVSIFILSWLCIPLPRVSILHGFSWVWCFWFAFVMGDLHLFHFGGALFIKVSFIANIVHEYIVILECGVFIFVIIRVFYVCVIVTFYNLPHFSPVLISLSSQFLSIFVWFSPGTNPCALRFSLFSAIVGTGLTFVFLYLFFYFIF